MKARPRIGIFDSGVGGLTVAGAIGRRLPGLDILYLGDTARLPYGTKSADTVKSYALQCMALLIERGVDAVVVACNTATAHALPDIDGRWPGLPVIGVVEPGSAAAAVTSVTGRIAVLATEGTVRSGAYPRAIARLRPGATVEAAACPLFVALAEEGWTDGPIAEMVADRYLAPLFDRPEGVPDTVVLGCTHFPLLAAVIARRVGSDVAVVDSADTVAEALAARLAAEGLIASDGSGGAIRLMATDAPERFARIAARFLGRPVDEAEVELAELRAPATSG